MRVAKGEGGVREVDQGYMGGIAKNSVQLKLRKKERKGKKEKGGLASHKLRYMCLNDEDGNGMDGRLN